MSLILFRNNIGSRGVVSLRITNAYFIMCFYIAAFKTPASKISTSCLSNLQENTNTKLQASVRRLLPAILEKQVIKPSNMIDEINKEFENIENEDLNITCKSTINNKKQLTFNTPRNLSNKAKLNSTGKEKFTVYEDINESSPEVKIRSMKLSTRTASSNKKKVKSSIPLPVTADPGRVTRNRKI